jgi:hypothetical protein
VKTILRYPLILASGQQSVKMPQGAEILYAGVHEGDAGDVLDLWALVDSDALPQTRKFHVVETGLGIDFSIKKYLGAIQTEGGMNVWHIFEEV